MTHLPTHPKSAAHEKGKRNNRKELYFLCMCVSLSVDLQTLLHPEVGILKTLVRSLIAAATKV